MVILGRENGIIGIPWVLNSKKTTAKDHIGGLQDLEKKSH